MGDHRLMLVTIALAATLFAGHAAAGPGDDFAGREKGTVTFIDRQQNLIQLDNGTEFHTMDPRLLQNVQEGMRVVVDFVGQDGRNELNSITPVTAP
jgi:hypothetical protein